MERARVPSSTPSRGFLERMIETSFEDTPPSMSWIWTTTSLPWTTLMPPTERRFAVLLQGRRVGILHAEDDTSWLVLASEQLALLYRDSRVPTLSPAYDLVCTGIYEGIDHDLGLRLGGRSGSSRSHWGASSPSKGAWAWTLPGRRFARRPSGWSNARLPRGPSFASRSVRLHSRRRSTPCYRRALPARGEGRESGEPGALGR
jgi:hypothetical protein